MMIDSYCNKNLKRKIANFHICHWVIIHQTLIRLYIWRWQLLVQYCAAFTLSFLKITHVTSLLQKQEKDLHWTNANFYGQFLFRSTRQNKNKNLCALPLKLLYQKILISVLLSHHIYTKDFITFYLVCIMNKKCSLIAR